jgi:dihydroneopterin aldolase
MMHRIDLTGLRVFAYHGALEFERQYGQTFVIDASVWLDASAAAAGDDLTKTLNYATLADLLVANAKTNPVDLLETLAERLLAEVMDFGGSTIRKAAITVHKPEAPIQHEFSDVSVTVEAERG